LVVTKQDLDNLTDFLSVHVNPTAASGQKPLQTAQK